VSNSLRYGRNIRPASGFTLVELMIVVSVVILLLVIAVPNFAKMIDRSRLKGAADAIVNLVASARAASVQRNRDVAISFGGSSPAWCVGANGAADVTAGNAVSTATACDCTTASNCSVGDTGNFTVDSSNYNSVTMGTQPSSFTFDSRLGTINDMSTTPSLTLTSPKGTYKLTLTVAVLGQPSLCVPSGSPDIPGYSSC
jgi:type IV fimbrial biogenesis protein FimT